MIRLQHPTFGTWITVPTADKAKWVAAGWKPEDSSKTQAKK